MYRYVVGAAAALLGLSSALAAQQPNYDASFAAAQSLQVVAKRKPASVISAPIRKGSIRIAARPLPSLAGYPTSVDAKLGKPVFLWAAADMKRAPVAPIKAAKVGESASRSYLEMQASALGLDKAALRDAKLMQMHDLGKGPVIARYQQMRDGLEVFGRQLNVLMDRNLNLVATSGYFAPAAADPASTSLGGTRFSAPAFELDAKSALANAFKDFSGEAIGPAAFVAKRGVGAYTVYKPVANRGEIVIDGEARSKRVYFYDNGAYIPAYYVEVAGHSVDFVDSHAYGYVISAKDGRVLFRKNQIDKDYSYNAYADAAFPYQPYDSPLGNGYEPFTGTAPNGNLPRTPATLNLVTLDHGPIATNDPWLPAGATVTTGNNVDAYLDLASPDGFTPASADLRTTTTGSNSFNYPYTPDADPSTASQRNFAVVNLFYINNWLHDWWYGNGFDEASGNAQSDNYGRGGLGNDPLHAEGQDYSGRNNANEATPADGASPRQQMYLFNGPINGEVTVSAPYTSSYTFDVAAFGAQVFDVTGTVVAAAPNNGCATLTNPIEINGKIALIDRGSCTFTTKVKNAQDAGATAVLIANNTTGAPPGLGGTDATITIGTLSLSQADGATIRGNLPVTARLRRSASIDVDGTVDIQVIAHEWFHTTSNRLVGNASGLVNQQGGGMGEGWSDFSAQMLSVRPEDRGVAGNDQYQGAYSSGYYVTRDAYFGIRRAPYSTSFSINPLTFKHISNGVPLPTTAPIAFGATGTNNAEVHNTGEIWCNVLWEIYAALLNDPRYSFAQAQERMKSYVIAGLKMTPNAPTMLEARDALLAAARATDDGDFRLMATAFAKRGMGLNATAPDRYDANNANAVEDYTALAGRLLVVDASLDFGYVNGAAGYIDNDGVLDPGETALLSLTLLSNGTQDITTPVVANLSANGDVTFGNSGSITFPASPSSPIRYGSTVTGTITVKLNSATQTAQPLTLSLSFPDSGPSPNSVFEPAPASLDLFVNYDLAPSTRAVEDLEQPLAAVRDWSRLLIGSGMNWQVIDGNQQALGFGTGNVWFVPDNGTPSDVRLTTPALPVGGSAFSMRFDHYFSFEFDANFNYDGGVIEISQDGGATWNDVLSPAGGGTFTTGTTYNGSFLALGPDGVATPDDTGGAPGFVRDNSAANGGKLEHLVLSFGTAYAGKTVRLRFREVTDSGSGRLGWFVDNIAFTGLTNVPFSSVVPEDGVTQNQPPVANAGPDQTDPTGRLVTLDGTGSTDDAGVTAYAWTQDSGPTATLAGANTAQPTFTPTTRGTYVFRLTVQDVRTASSSDTVSVTVLAAPVANAGPDQTVAGGSTVTLDGRASTVDPSSTLSYAWTQTAGTSVALQNATTATPSFTAGTARGTMSFQLTVTDTRTDATSSDTVSITIASAPVANAGSDQTVATGTTVALDGRASTFDPSSSLRYAWTQTAGVPVVLQNANTATPFFPAGAALGARTFQLLVTDNNTGASSGDTVIITTLAAPVANAGADQNVVVGSTVALDGRASTVDPSSTLSYKWTQTAGTTVTLQNATTATPKFTAGSTRGSVSFQLTVTDNVTGGRSSNTVSVMVLVAPRANAGPDRTVNTGSSSTKLDGTGSTVDPSSSLSYSWTKLGGIGDAQLANANSVTPTVIAGTHVETSMFLLVVTDRKTGATSTDTVRVDVEQPFGGAFGFTMLLPALLAVWLRRRIRR